MECAAFGELFGQMTPEEEKTQHLEAIETAHRFFAEHAKGMKFVAYLQTGDQIELIV